MSDKEISLALSFLNSALIFTRRIFVLNKYDKKLSKLQFITFFLSILNGFLFWISLNSFKKSLVYQITTNITATIISWTVMIFLVNDECKVPTRQQFVALLFYILTDTSIMIQTRLLV